MEENRHSQRHLGARSSPTAIDVAKIREQLVGSLPRLRRFARALTRTPLEADDLVHTAVVRALARAEQLRAQLRPLPWLLSMVSRVWSEEMPARNRQSRAFNIEPAAEGVSEARRELLTVQAALARLQEDQRRAVALVLVEGFSYRDAADLEGVALPTLTARLLRGRQGLLRTLGAEPGMGRASCDEMLMAYVDGELEIPARAKLEDAMASDQVLASRIDELRAQAQRLRCAFDRTLEEPVPERLLTVTRSAPTLQRRNNVIPLRRKVRPARLTWVQAGTLAAALVTGIVLGELLPRLSSPQARSAHQGVLADRTLATALTAQLPGDPSRGVMVGASFHERHGGYCRSFALRDAPVVGLACRDSDGWRVRSLVENGPRPTTAGVPLPPGLSRSLQAELGAPLDAHAELVARSRGWR